MEMKEVISKLDSVELELLRLKAMLLPKIKVSKKELNEIKRLKVEIAAGSWVSGRELINKL